MHFIHMIFFVTIMPTRNKPFESNPIQSRMRTQRNLQESLWFEVWIKIYCFIGTLQCKSEIKNWDRNSWPGSKLRILEGYSFKWNSEIEFFCVRLSGKSEIGDVKLEYIYWNRNIQKKHNNSRHHHGLVRISWWRHNCRLINIRYQQNMSIIYGSRYSKMDQVKFVEDSL